MSTTALTTRPERPPGWELRLREALARARGREFDAREWNCARFAHSCACAVSLRLLPFRHHGSLEGSVDAVLSRVDPSLALRGDIVMADVPEPSLGVCIGSHALFVTAEGLMRLTMDGVRVAWCV